MGRADKAELAEKVSEILDAHEVSFEMNYAWGLEVVMWCPSCGYLDELNHRANIVIEYLEGYWKVDKDE